MRGGGAIEAFVLVQDFQRFGEHGFGAFVELLQRARNAPAEIDRGRPRLGDSLGRGADVPSRTGGEHDAERARGTQRRGAAHG